MVTLGETIRERMELRKDDTRILQFQPKELTFKIMRDTRFSNDKSQYNPVFRCHIAPAEKLPVPVGAFLFLSPGGNSFLGGGLFVDMFKDATKMVRDYIEDCFGDELLEDSGKFIQYACERFRRMKPFNDYLNQALKGFEMPKR